MVEDRYRNLLRKYSGYIRRAGYVEAASQALRMGSANLVDVIAFVATRDKFTALELRQYLYATSKPTLNFRYPWLATLGRVTALQSFQKEEVSTAEADMKFGLACLEIANRHLPRDRQFQQFHRLEVELLMHFGQLEEARRLLGNHPFLKDRYYGYLESDINNPHLSGSARTYDDWWVTFNRPFTENDLEPIELATPWPHFNELKVERVRSVAEGPLVTVIMTSFKPHPRDFLVAVNSILEQSWRNIELIIVDDASPPEFDDTLQKVSGLDPRITLVKLDKNGGTYRARNAALRLAKGEYVTGQDSDDWSHPQRVQLQVEHLLNDATVSGAVVEAIRVDERLVRTFPGRLPERFCEVSLMLKRELAHELGGYLDARKGADSEFRFRLEQFTDKDVYGIRKPLYLTRIGHESLSGADFKPGWSHPVRRAFWNASRYWHKKVEHSSLRRRTEEWEPLPVPNRFKINAPERAPHFDVVLIGDWRAYGNTQRAFLDAIDVHLQAGQSVGVMHLESVLSSSKETTRLADEVQDLINRRLVTEVVPDEYATAELVIIRDPIVLQFAPSRGINLTAKTTLVTPYMPPHSVVSSGILYDPLRCTNIAEALFGGPVLWTSEDPEILQVLQQYINDITLCLEPFPIVFQTEKWLNGRPSLRGGYPTIGRHSENFEELWPDNLALTRQLWPEHDSVDVRVLGDIRALVRKHNQSIEITDWLVFRESEIQPEAFMSGLDFFVYFPHKGFEQSYCREAVEAAASGALVILPESFRKIHGASAIYANPDETPDVIEHFIQDSAAFTAKKAEQIRTVHHLIGNTLYLPYLQSLTRNASHKSDVIWEKHAHS